MKLRKRLRKKNVNNFVNNIYCEDCRETMEHLPENSVDLILTSPPYNTSRNIRNERALKENEGRYKEYNDAQDNEDYIKFLVQDVFNQGYNKVLKPNGVILFNLSYGSENPSVMFELIHSISSCTCFMVADVICWKKSNALPNNTSPNKLTRICEFVFVICRQDEYKTYRTNKQITKVSKVGQKYYSSIYNFVEARNNDGTCKLNKATFSTDFVTALLEMYAKDNKNFIVYDSFNGTGTTSVACKKYGCSYVGSELSKEQCEYAERRLEEC